MKPLRATPSPASLIRRAACLCTLAAAGAAGAVTIGGPDAPGYIGLLDDQARILVNAHPNDQNPFFDVYAFTLTQPAGVFGYIFPLSVVDATLPPEVGATITGIALLDADSNIVAFDADGQDGFSLGYNTPGAGNFAFLVAGVGGPLNGVYVGLITASVIPEPASWALLLGGLGVVGAAARRRVGH